MANRKKKKQSCDGHIVDGQFFPYLDDRWLDILNNFEGEAVVVTVEPPRSGRSLLQNNYYWGVVLQMIEDETGQDSEDLNDFFAIKFLTVKTTDIPKAGFQVDHVERPSSLDALPFIEYYKKIQAFAMSELGIFIPDPNEEEMWHLQRWIENDEKKRIRNEQKLKDQEER